MHVCYISQEYPPDTGWGGIGSYTYEMARGLVRAGHRVTVISRATDMETTVNESGVDVHRIVPSPEWNRWPGCWRLNGYWPGFAWAAALRLRRIHSRCPVDLVEAAECRADSLFVGFMPRRPALIVRLHTPRIFVDSMNGISPDAKDRLTYGLELLAIQMADAITAPSHAVVDLTRTWLALKGRHISVVANPIDTSTFAPDGQRRKGEVLFAGRLEQRKMGVLPEALAKVLRQSPDASFRFVGSIAQDPAGRSWRDRLVDSVPEADRDRLHFETVHRSALVDRYRAASVYVLTSPWENFPYVLLEAMACGMPVVAVRAGGVPEMVHDGETAVLVDQEPNELADALCHLLGDDTRRQRLGLNARRWSEDHFNIDRIVPRMLDIYHQVVQGVGRA